MYRYRCLSGIAIFLNIRWHLAAVVPVTLAVPAQSLSEAANVKSAQTALHTRARGSCILNLTRLPTLKHEGKSILRAQSIIL